MSWSAADIADQAGRRVVVTGANSGLGAVTARELAEHGARVTIACRNLDAGAEVADRIDGDVEVRPLDLADLASVREFAEATGEIDVLVNNAGVMAVPRRRTVDGFEQQIGVNFLGPFALTLALLPRITDRVVTLSSVAHRIGRIDIDDLTWQRRRYHRWLAYGQSKLADLMFAYELGRRLDAIGSPVRSVAAHPGYAATGLQGHSESLLDGLVMTVADRTVAQNAAGGARPVLFAATGPEVPNGAYYGPDGPGEVRGAPRRVGSSRASRDTGVAAALWDRAMQLTGTTGFTARAATGD